MNNKSKKKKKLFKNFLVIMSNKYTSNDFNLEKKFGWRCSEERVKRSGRPERANALCCLSAKTETTIRQSMPGYIYPNAQGAQESSYSSKQN